MSSDSDLDKKCAELKGILIGNPNIEYDDLTASQTIKCYLCPSTFLTPEQCLQHIALHENKTGFICPTCNYAAKSEKKLESHINTDHKGENINRDGDSHSSGLVIPTTSHSMVNFIKTECPSPEPCLTKRTRIDNTTETTNSNHELGNFTTSPSPNIPQMPLNNQVEQRSLLVTESLPAYSSVFPMITSINSKIPCKKLPKPKRNVRFEDSLNQVKEFQFLDSVCVNLKLKEENDEDPFVPLSPGNFNNALRLNTIEYDNYGSLHSFFLELTRGTIFIIYGTQEKLHLIKNVMRGIFESIGMWEECYPYSSKLEENDEHTGRICVGLTLLDHLDTKTQQRGLQSMRIIRYYKDGKLFSITTSYGKGFSGSTCLTDPKSWNTIPTLLLGSNIKFPRLMYMCEENLRWLKAQKPIWHRLKSEILGNRNELYRMELARLYQTRRRSTEVNTWINNLEYIISRFENIFKEFLCAEELEGGLVEDLDSEGAFTVYVKPRGQNLKDPESAEEADELVELASEFEKRTCFIGLFFAFWSIMDDVPVLACDLFPSDGASDNIPINGIQNYIYNSVKLLRQVNTTQQLFFGSPYKDGLRRVSTPIQFNER